MKVGVLVIVWLTLFFLSCFFLCKYLNINDVLNRTIFCWSFCMVFVGIFEMMLLFNMTYLENKGKSYYHDNKCYWLDDISMTDMFSSKMYMDLYADYSLSDKRYCHNVNNIPCSRFVLSGEVVHGIFCLMLAPIILYLFCIKSPEINIFLTSIIFSSVQFAIIIWYLSTVFIEMNFVKNDKFWWPPLLWNVPWVIIPIYIIYNSFRKLI